MKSSVEMPKTKEESIALSEKLGKMYSDLDKIKKEIGWEPETMFKEGIRKTIKWYFENNDWMEHVTSGDYEKYYTKMYSGR